MIFPFPRKRNLQSFSNNNSSSQREVVVLRLVSRQRGEKTVESSFVKGRKKCSELMVQEELKWEVNSPHFLV